MVDLVSQALNALKVPNPEIKKLKVQKDDPHYEDHLISHLEDSIPSEQKARDDEKYVRSYLQLADRIWWEHKF